jgi:hypothetical protein
MFDVEIVRERLRTAWGEFPLRVRGAKRPVEELVQPHSQKMLWNARTYLAGWCWPQSDEAC